MIMLQPLIFRGVSTKKLKQNKCYTTISDMKGCKPVALSMCSYHQATTVHIDEVVVFPICFYFHTKNISEDEPIFFNWVGSTTRFAQSHARYLDPAPQKVFGEPQNTGLVSG